MEHNSFTCQFCNEHQEWDTRQAADSAAVWHLFEAHPMRWATIAGPTIPTYPAADELGRQLVGSA